MLPQSSELKAPEKKIVQIKRARSSAIPYRSASALAPRQLEKWFSTEMGLPVEVIYTNNKSTMVSFRKSQGILKLRLHRIFVGASEKVREALLAYIRDNDPKAGEVLDQYIRKTLPSVPKKEGPLQSRGAVFDLKEIFDDLNSRYFHDAVQARIGWSKNAKKRGRRKSMRLGVFYPDQKIIRIHPALDQDFVPLYYISWIIFHEMLHEVYGVEQKGKRRSVHPPEFVALEESFPDFKRCKQWEADYMNRLLRY